MGITLDKPIVIAQTQNFRCDGVNLLRNGQGKMIANIRFVVLNQDNKPVDNFVLNYAADKFNDFWNNFNNASFLYDELVKAKKINVPVTPTVENDFLN